MKISYTYMDLFTVEYYRDGKLARAERSGAMLETVAEQAHKIAIENGFNRVIIRRHNTGKTVAIIE